MKNEVLERITEICDLLSQIKNYWTNMKIVKAPNNFKSLELNISVYTFLREDKEQNRIAYIIREKIDLMELTVNQELEYLIKQIKELIPATNND